jgi:sugar-specific transcriptional regulator TrmB
MDNKVTKAAQVIKDAVQEDNRKCSEEIEKTLEKFNREMSPVFWFEDGEWKYMVKIQPRRDRRSPVIPGTGMDGDNSP